MAVKSYRVTVGTTPVRLDVNPEADKVGNLPDGAPRGDGQSLLTRPRGSSIFVGGPDVTAAAGWEQFAEEAISRDLLPGDIPWAVVASGSVTVHCEQDGI